MIQADPSPYEVVRAAVADATFDTPQKRLFDVLPPEKVADLGLLALSTAPLHGPRGLATLNAVRAAASSLASSDQAVLKEGEPMGPYTQAFLTIETNYTSHLRMTG